MKSGKSSCEDCLRWTDDSPPRYCSLERSRSAGGSIQVKQYLIISMMFEDLDIRRVFDMFGKYLEASERSISKAEAQLRMFQKYNESPLLLDIHTLLPIEQSKNLTEQVAEQVFWNVFDNIVSQLPGEDWEGLEEFLEQKGN